MPFTQNVRVRSLLLKLGELDHSVNRADHFFLNQLGRGETTPLHLRIYANHTSIIDFSEAESTRPQLDISLLDGQIEVTEYPLRVAAFANINSLSLFFVSVLSGRTLYTVVTMVCRVNQLVESGREFSTSDSKGIQPVLGKTLPKRLTCPPPMLPTRPWWTN